MKKMLIILMIALIFSCNMWDDGSSSHDDSTVPEENETDNYPSDPLLPVTPEDTTDPDPIASNKVVLALYDGEDLKYYDGTSFTSAYTGINFEYAGNKKGAVGDILHVFDDYGASSSSYQLPGVPDKLLITNESGSGRNIIDGENVWTFEVIDPDTAQSLGAPRDTYTKIYKNSTEFGSWNLNDFEIDEVYQFNNRIIVKDTAEALINLSDSAVPYKVGSDYFISDIDFTNKTAIFNEVSVSFQMNYFYTSRWQTCGDIFQSQHGLTFSAADGITEYATALQDFIDMEWYNGEHYSLWPAGERIENSESVSYWIDSTSGWLVRYVPSIDSYGMPVRLFVGPMNYGTGNTLAPDIKPEWIDDDLYFHWSGTVYVYDPDFGTIQVFSDDQEVLAW